jgi:nickel/cobalt transporter (NicO) family protein
MRVSTTALSFPPGAAGLSTLRLECGLVATFPGKPGPHVLNYRDTNLAGRIGWHEIAAVGDRATLLRSTVPTASISAELTRYPKDLLASPLDVRSASVEFRPGGTSAPPERVTGAVLLPRGIDGVTRAFTSFLSRRTLTLPLGFLALVIAIGLGAIHALGPGHGKTVIAAYAVGQRGSLRQTVMIGATVTATHTAGVLVLGVLLSASRTVSSERLYPFLGIASGALLCVIGAGLLARAIRNRTSASNGHRHDHVVPPMGMRAIAGLGVAGGIVPSPSALVVLLGAIALGRAWFGVVLVVAYGLGMAVTLSGAGLLLSKARAFAETRSGQSRPRSRIRRIAEALPVVTSTIIVVVGITLAARSLLQI